MKKLIFIALLLLLIIPFVEAKDNGTIEHIGNDIKISYNGTNITLRDETIKLNTQKCPVGYHVGSQEDRSKLINIRYNIKGQNYEYMKLNEKDGLYSVLEIIDYSKIDDIEKRSGYEYRINEFMDDLKITGGDLQWFKTSSYGEKHVPIILEYYKTHSLGGYSSRGNEGYIRLTTCSNSANPIACSKMEYTRCFKNDNDTDINNGYSKEYNDAYVFAYNKRITTMDTIERANMYGEIKRMEIAKMLSNWVKSIGYYADPNISCNFSDTASVKGDLATAIIESCQYGIMGQGITKFRPYDNITKAEVATAVSRILRQSKYDGGNPYYINHINALKNVGVVSNTLNVNTNMIRGDVMVMLMKANDILEKQ